MVKGWKTSDIYGRMLVQYGDNCMSQRKVYERMQKLKEDVRLLIKRVHQRIRENRRISADYI